MARRYNLASSHRGVFFFSALRPHNLSIEQKTRKPIPHPSHYGNPPQLFGLYAQTHILPRLIILPHLILLIASVIYAACLKQQSALSCFVQIRKVACTRRALLRLFHYFRTCLICFASPNAARQQTLLFFSNRFNLYCRRFFV